MKWMLRLSLVVLCALAFNGCAMMSEEDREWYGRGWLNPKELDDKPYHPIKHPEKTGGLGDSPTRSPADSPAAARAQVSDPILDQ